jgi:hypothetical protein
MFNPPGLKRLAPIDLNSMTRVLMVHLKTSPGNPFKILPRGEIPQQTGTI